MVHGGLRCTERGLVQGGNSEEQGDHGRPGEPGEYPFAMPMPLRDLLILACTARKKEVTFDCGNHHVGVNDPRLEAPQPAARKQVTGIPVGSVPLSDRSRETTMHDEVLSMILDPGLQPVPLEQNGL